MRGAYKRCRHRHGASLVTSLHHRPIQTGNGIGESAEVAGQESVPGEVGVEDVEELHEASGNVFGQSVWGAAVFRNRPVQGPGELGTQGRRELALCSSLSDTQESSRKRVELGVIVFVELARFANHHAALLRHLRLDVVANGIVREIIEHLHGKEKAWRVYVRVPVKDGSIDDLDVVQMTCCVERLFQILELEVGEGGRNFDDSELRALVDLVVCVADEVQHVYHERTVSGTHLVDNQVMVGVEGQLVI